MAVGSQAAKPAWDFDDILEDMCAAYRINRAPIEVDFRRLVPFGSGVDRSTHLMHSYPAKLLPNIPIFFLHCQSLAPQESLIYDPFCGTGTVLVEGILAGHHVAGADANPLARLIASAKTTPLTAAAIKREIDRILLAYPDVAPKPFSPVVDQFKWFSATAITGLGKLASTIDRTKRQDVRTFLQVAFSQIVRKVSQADPRMTVPVRTRAHRSNGQDADPLALFLRTAAANALRLRTLPRGNRLVTIGEDARQPITKLNGTARADFIITSPPYAGAQKYIRASSLSIGWLGLAPESKLRTLESRNIGREHLRPDEQSDEWPMESASTRDLLGLIWAINPLRANILATYLREMRTAARATVKSLRSTGHLVLVMGDNSVCGIPVPTSRLVREIFEDEGLSVVVELVDTIKSRGLMTKRNKTAGLIAREHVFLFRK